MLIDYIKRFWFQRKSSALPLLIGIVLFHFVNNIIWLSLDKTYLLHESAEHFLLSYKVFDSLKHHAFPWLSDVLSSLGSTYRWHGVFIQYLTAPFYLIFGATQDTGVLVNGTISLVVLILSIYGIGKILYEEATGVLAAFIVSMYPLVFTQSRIYMLDLPLTAVVAFSILLLLKSNGFSNNKYSGMFAFTACVGFLIKFNFLMFIMGPLVFVFYGSFKSGLCRNTTKNIVKTLGMMLLIFFMFYGSKFGELWGRIYESSWFYWGSSCPERFPLAIVANGMPYYLHWFVQNCINRGISFFLFLVFVLGIFSRKAHRSILWVWLLVPVFGLALLYPYANTDRYYMPILPALALLSSAVIIMCRSVMARRILVIIILGFSLFQYCSISYRMDFVPAKIPICWPAGKGWHSIPLHLFNRKISFSGYRSDHNAFSYPISSDWKSNEILDLILMDSASFRNDANILFIGDSLQLYEPFVYEAALRHLPFDIHAISMAVEPAYSKNKPLIPESMEGADYVVYVHDKDNNFAPSVMLKQRLSQAKESFTKSIEYFDLMNEFPYAGKSVLSLYKNKGSYIKIAKNGLEVYFRSGVFKIYYQNRKISVWNGFVMFFSNKESLYSSMDFQWKVLEVNPEQFIVNMQGRKPCLSGTVKFEIMNDHKIAWNVDFNGEAVEHFEDFYIGTIVQKDYSKWQSSQDRGRFLWRNSHEFGTIKSLDHGSKPTILLSSVSKELPVIIFSTGTSPNIVPCVSWGWDWRLLGLCEKDIKISSNVKRTFSGDVSFSQINP